MPEARARNRAANRRPDRRHQVPGLAGREGAADVCIQCAGLYLFSPVMGTAVSAGGTLHEPAIGALDGLR